MIKTRDKLVKTKAGERGEENRLPFCSLLLLETHSEGDKIMKMKTLSTPGIPDRELIHLCLDVLIPANAHLTSAILDPQKPELQDEFLQALV